LRAADKTWCKKSGCGRKILFWKRGGTCPFIRKIKVSGASLAEGGEEVKDYHQKINTEKDNFEEEPQAAG